MSLRAGKGLPEYFILGEKSGKGRDTGNGQGCRQECPVGERQLAFQAAHFTDVLPASQGMDNTAGTQEREEP